MTPQVSTCPTCHQPMTPDGDIWACAHGHLRIERMRDDDGKLMKPPPAVHVHVSDVARVELIAAIAAMPEEAFGYLLRQARLDFPRLASDGVFRPESRASFNQVAAAAEAYANRRT